MKKVVLGEGKIIIHVDYITRTGQGTSVAICKAKKKTKVGTITHSGPIVPHEKPPSDTIIITSLNNEGLDVLIQALERLRKPAGEQ